MGIFDRLFSAGAEEPSPSEAPVGDPYRGAGFVEVPRIEPVALPLIDPLWDSWTRILAIERGGELPLGSIVYDGEDNIRGVRRVRFEPAGAVIEWQAGLTRDQLSEHLVVCVDDRVIIPRETGLAAHLLGTGHVCWELPHPAALIQQPVQFPDGDLLFVFADRSWMRLSPRDGAFRASGTVRNDEDAEQLAAACRTIVPEPQESVVYGGREVSLSSNGITVSESGSSNPEDRPGPTVGEYPIDEWTPDDVVVLFGDKLAVWLQKRWNDETSGAIGLFEPTSLEPLRLIELGTFELRSAYRVGDFLVVNGDMFGKFTSVIVDIANERVVACSSEGGAAVLFDHDGELIWRARL